MLIRDFFSNIFSWPRSRTGRNADSAFVHALVPSNLPIALAENEVGIHPAALNLRQGVDGVPEVAEAIHALQQLLRGRLMHTGGVFDPVIAVEGIVRLVVADALGVSGSASLPARSSAATSSGTSIYSLVKYQG